MFDLLRVYFQEVRNVTVDYGRRYPFRLAAIVLFVLLSMAGTYWFIWKGFYFLVRLGGLGALIIKKLVFVLFFMTFIMSAASFGLLYYAFSFRSRHSRFLVSLPIAPWRIVLVNFCQAAFFACWIPGLGLLMFMAAYSRISGQGFSLALIAVPFVLPFMFLCCLAGYWACVFFLRYLSPRKALLAGVILMLLPALGHKQETASGHGLFYALSEDVAFIQLAQRWYMPFAWPAWGILESEGGLNLRVLVYLANLVSLSALAFAAVLLYSQKSFLSLFHRHSLPQGKKQYRPGFFERIFLSGKAGPMRAFCLKDIKIFSREPALYLQFLVFFGLLFFYFLNLRRFSYHMLGPQWKSLILFLNTFSVLCITAAFAMRFVFPQWSMEGKSYWLIKLSPVSIQRVHGEKLVFWSVVTCVIAVTLVELSCAQLSVGFFVAVVSGLAAFLTAYSVTGISLGLGAYFADFKRDYYLNAVESLGGTIALVANFVYVAGGLFLFVRLSRIPHIGQAEWFKSRIVLAALAWIVFSLVLVAAVNRLGLKKLSQKES